MTATEIFIEDLKKESNSILDEIADKRQEQKQLIEEQKAVFDVYVRKYITTDDESIRIENDKEHFKIIENWCKIEEEIKRLQERCNHINTYIINLKSMS